MPEKRFDLGDYVEVRDRIRILYELFPQARIETDYTLTSEPDDKPKVICRAFVYRKPEDERPAGHGTSWLYLPGTTPYTRGSEVENAETSAVGRAIGMLGILIDKSIATSNEIENKREDAPKQTPQEAGEFEKGALVGTIELSKDAPEFLPKVSAEGGTLVFKLRDKSGGIKVVAHGKLAYDLSMEKDDVVGQRAVCFGSVDDESFTPKGQTRKVTYQVLTLSRIRVAGKEFPVPEAETVPLFDEDALPEPPDDVELVGEGDHAA
jgi:hypothetical protein